MRVHKGDPSGYALYPNPLGYPTLSAFGVCGVTIHHGESETYFVVIGEHNVAFDHKYKVAYNALTCFLCDDDVCSPDNPEEGMTGAIGSETP